MVSSQLSHAGRNKRVEGDHKDKSKSEAVQNCLVRAATAVLAQWCRCCHGALYYGGTALILMKIMPLLSAAGHRPPAM
eukprot:scaffold6832_cov81-Skeletonema_menzelii.AAC.22